MRNHRTRSFMFCFFQVQSKWIPVQYHTRAFPILIQPKLSERTRGKNSLKILSKPEEEKKGETSGETIQREIAPPRKARCATGALGGEADNYKERTERCNNRIRYIIQEQLSHDPASGRKPTMTEVCNI